MNNKVRLKKLIVDIVIPVLIFALIAGVLTIEQKGFRTGTGNNDGGLIDEDTW